MRKYLGEFPVDISMDDRFKDFKEIDWVQYFIERYGQIDGDHHKQWVMDQCMRIIHGTKLIIVKAKWDDGLEEYRVKLEDKPSKKYLNWVKEMCDGEDGPETYSYDEGIAP